MTLPTDNRRMMALDVMRGLTVALMILVNNPGTWQHIYAPLRHAQWHGLTPTDLVFPFFMFIMGISTAFSLRKFDFRLNWPLVRKILMRTVLIYLTGVLIGRFAALCRGVAGDSWMAGLTAAFDVSNIRILGVLQRLALCYCAAAFLGALLSRRTLAILSCVFLAGYAVVLLLFDGFEFALSNVVGAVDRAILGESHMYHEWAFGERLALDPEGLLSTIPSIVHTLIGFLAGRMIIDTPDIRQRMLNLLLVGAAMTLAGWLLSYGVPINKKIWSPTFVLTTCGMASSLLALLIWMVDVKGRRVLAAPLLVFGINPLFLYVVADILAIVMGVAWPGLLYNLFLPVSASPEMASALGALAFVGICWLLGYPLYRRHIIIKL